MGSKLKDDDLEAGALPGEFDSDHPKDRALLDRLSAKLLRLDREAVQLAATMRRKPRLT